MSKRQCGDDDDDAAYVLPPGKRTFGSVVERMLQQRYEVDVAAPVGRGTSGKVFRVTRDHYTDRAPPRALVVKVMVPELGATPFDRRATEEELESETAAYGRLGAHPGVARFVESYHLSARGGYLVLEECVGGSLYSLMKRGTPFSVCRVRKYARQLFEALAYFERCRVVHRDIKPENLLFDSESNLRVADFGLAHLYSDSKSEAGGAPFATVVTTLWFRPPEVLLPGLMVSITDEYEESDRLAHSYPLDVWSAGCVVAEMASGCALFAADSEVDLLCRQTRELGTPPASEWPEATLYIEEIHTSEVARPPIARPWTTHPLAMKAGEIGRDLLAHTVAFVPRLRLCARAVLEHPFFTMDTNAVAVS